MKTFFLLPLFLIVACTTGAQLHTDEFPVEKGKLKITPVQHASLVLQWKGRTIYVDPAGGAERYQSLPKPEIILITDIHSDHMDKKTLDGLKKDKAVFIVPQAVADSLKPLYTNKMIIMKNGESVTEQEVGFTAIPMYNLPETADSRHPKGRGNGYVINISGKNVYISGDTEDTPEMRALRNIDIAFVCMNLPYTMDVNQAASAVLEFKPGNVYPYHHRGQDINEFKRLVNEKNNDINVRLRDWYPE
ncbi:MBL fold metallo-hydrolase [Polluticoccus soli]|uniref:MBL fold metallo-hydrolase n=1 Tax=Polluticoccus soli TaxID=3034150 RepID=UPI0023E2FA0D|nr:MBL fold metallo-hydrolase [Flavipsychrobacter sp. JY13-12]